MQHLHLIHIFYHSETDGTWFATSLYFKEDSATWTDIEIIDFLGLEDYFLLSACHRYTNTRLNLVEYLIV